MKIGCARRYVSTLLLTFMATSFLLTKNNNKVDAFTLNSKTFALTEIPTFPSHHVTQLKAQKDHNCVDSQRPTEQPMLKRRQFVSSLGAIAMGTTGSTLFGTVLPANAVTTNQTDTGKSSTSSSTKTTTTTAVPASKTTTTTTTTTTTPSATTTTLKTTTPAVAPTKTSPSSTSTMTTTTKLENPGDVKNCPDFKDYKEAKAWYDKYFPLYGDVARLDGNNDGIPCESLPGAPPKKK